MYVCKQAFSHHTSHEQQLARGCPVAPSNAKHAVRGLSAVRPVHICSLQVISGLMPGRAGCASHKRPFTAFKVIQTLDNKRSRCRGDRSLEWARTSRAATKTSVERIGRVCCRDRIGSNKQRFERIAGTYVKIDVKTSEHGVDPGNRERT